MKDGNNKFAQISSIFSQFSEENKDKLIRTATKMLKTQRTDRNSVAVPQNADKTTKGRCPRK